jgi:hypothetical protein
MNSNVSSEVIKAEQLWAAGVVANAKSILLRANKNASGRLYNSIRYNVNSQGKIVFQYAPEGKWVQQGRLKHPGRGVNPKGKFVASLKDWIKEKGLKGRDQKTGRYISNQSLAYLIARGINKKGIKPLPFMKMAIKASIKQLPKNLKKVLALSQVKKWKDALKTTKP